MASVMRTAWSRLCGSTRSATQASSSSGPGSAPVRGTTTATDWVWARAQPATFAHLVGDRAWPAAAYTDRAVSSILSEVVGPGA